MGRPHWSRALGHRRAAVALAAEGAAVAVAARRRDRLEALAQRIEADGDACSCSDVTREQQAHDAVERTVVEPAEDPIWLPAVTCAFARTHLSLFRATCGNRFPRGADAEHLTGCNRPRR